MDARIGDPLTALRGVGDAVAKKFAVLGIHTVGELLHQYPRRYDDYSTVIPIHKLRPGPITIQATIKQVTSRYVRRGMHITEAIASDDTGSIRVIWFNQPYRAASLKPEESYYLSGQYDLNRGRFSLTNPSVELVSSFPINTGRIVPIYRETKGLTSGQIRKTLREALPYIRALQETLPPWIVEERKLLSFTKAVEAIHFPDDNNQLEAARRRLGFEEVFELILAALLTKYELLKDIAPSIPFDEALAKTFVNNLPFKLTDPQRRVVWQIYQDIQQTTPMNRLVEGDVGSGKTVVAAMAAVMALAEGYQVAFMAPTELLARQHAETIYKLLEPLDWHTSVALLVGGMKRQEKETAYDHIANGHAKFIIGTHALIQERVDMHKLGMVIIDEQHRFGVEQRKKLMKKAGHMPHLLSLTATPIPRSLALTLYGELDVSIIDSKPPGRQPVQTEICSPNSRETLYKKISAELEQGRQMFVVCPLITESSVSDSRSVEQVYDEFRKKDFKNWRVGLLHGKMKADEKNAIMNQFLEHTIDILVSTTVIEVGVDIPNASIMLIEAAERFGLSQIHQLRGRVGRGGHAGYCYLMMSDSKQPPKRLQALERMNDGFRLAELDLQLRGPGAIYGTVQHGALDLRIAKLSDIKLITEARHAAQEFIDRGEDLLQYKQLYKHVMDARAVTHLN